jgi:hypothetical protein
MVEETVEPITGAIIAVEVGMGVAGGNPRPVRGFLIIMLLGKFRFHIVLRLM